MLTISSLKANLSADSSVHILNGATLSVHPGELHALMGPNGSGKSTLANILVGHPDYRVTGGTITWQGHDLLEMSPEERAVAGVFLAFQYPPAIPGVAIAHFLRLALNSQLSARGEQPIALAPFLNNLKVQMKSLNLPWSFAERSVNDGFSGGEKKRLEMLQMLVLKPKLVILDEIDSGLDIDAMKLVAATIQSLCNIQPETSVIAITHYQRLLTHLTPDHVHVFKDGKVVESGGPELAHRLEKDGYTHVR